VEDCKLRRDLIGFMRVSCLLIASKLQAQTDKSNISGTANTRAQTNLPELRVAGGEHGRSGPAAESSPKSFCELWVTLFV